MPFFFVDDKLHGHRKPRLAGKCAMGVWVLAGSWCQDHLTGGFVPATVLSQWGTRTDAKKLVAAGLWIEHVNEQGEKGWLFHDWADTQRSVEQIEQQRAKDRERFQRWKQRQSNASTNGVSNEGAPGTPSPGPSPSVVQVSSQSGWLTRAIDGLTDEDLQRIQTRLRCDRSHALAVVRNVLTKSPTPVGRPVPYVLRAIEDNPGQHAVTAQPPTKATCCPEPGHGSYTADNCGACRSEQIAGGA